MSSTSGTAHSDRPLLLLALAGVFAAFAAYGSWVPLDLHRVSVGEAVERFWQTPFVPFARASRSDFATNVLLFLPIGFFLVGAAAGRSRARAAAWVVPVALFSLALSVAIEFGQIFVSGRTPSWNDVFAETLGAGLGALAWPVLGPFVLDWTAGLFHSESAADRLFNLLGAYAALWTLLAILPFDFTVRLEELAQKYRAGRIVLVPFGGNQRLADLIATVLMAVPIGVFGVLAGIRWKIRKPVLAGLAIALGAALAAEFAQLLAFSRTADVTDVLLNGAGMAAGVYLAGRGHAAAIRPGEPGVVRLWPVTGLAAWTLLLIARHWSPFEFVTDGPFVRERLSIMFRVPFHSYYWGMPLYAFAEAMSKFLLGLPVGALLQLVWTPASAAARRLQAALVATLSLGLFLIVELGQVLVPSRVPDQTDVYIATAGALAGLWIVRLLTDSHSSRQKAPRQRISSSR